MSAPLAIWQRGYADRTLIKRAAAVDPQNVADIARLRRDVDPDTIGIALELVGARHKLEIKFGEAAQAMASDIAGAEQASSLCVARHKAQRFAERAPDQPVLDLCCGIGGDALGLQSLGLGVQAVDLDPVRAWMAKVNTGPGVTTRVADARDIDTAGRYIHIDPARRSASGRRHFGLENYRPGPDVLGQLIEQADAAAIKLGPGIDLDTLPWPGEVEFISDRGRLVQAVLWTGPFAKQPRCATLIGDDKLAYSLSGSPAPLALGPRLGYIHTVDPAIERAGLLGNLAADLGVHAPHPALGLLTADQPIDSPWLTGFEVLASMPWRSAKVRRWLADHDAGIVEVKTRGKAVDPDSVARALRGKAANSYTVFVHRWDTQKIAMISKRV
ncbi:MAG: class I SAM-dependent methyltransferase [Planctomycetota bacterium]